MFLKRILFVLFALALFASCENGGTLSGLKGSLANSEAVIVNSLSETLSVVYRENPRIVIPHLKGYDGGYLNTGSAPNQILGRNGLGYILNSRSNSLQVIDLEKLYTTDEISLGTGISPYLMVFYEDLILTTNFIGHDGNGDISIVKEDEGVGKLSVIDTIPLPSGSDLKPYSSTTYARPQGIAVSGSKLYVTLTNLGDDWFPGGPGLVAVIDITTRKLLKTIETTLTNPVYAYAKSSIPNKVFILEAGDFSGSGVVEIIDSTEDRIVRTVETGGAPYSMTVTDDGIAYVTDALGPHLLRFNANDYSLLNSYGNPIPVADPLLAPFNFISFVDVTRDGFLFALAFNSDDLYILDPIDGKTIDGPYTVGDGPIGMIVDK